MISNKTINGKYVEDIMVAMHDISKWLDVYNSNGKDIFGENHKLIASVLGIGIMAMIHSLEGFEDVIGEYASQEMNADDLLRSFGIKLEGKDGTVQN